MKFVSNFNQLMSDSPQVFSHEVPVWSSGSDVFGFQPVENGILDWFRGWGRQRPKTPVKTFPDRPVVSSYLSIVGYDSENSVLVVQFSDGSIFQYFGVPEGEYNNLMRADSHGQYFYYNIRDDYPWREIRHRLK